MSAVDTLVERLRERIADADADIADALLDAETTGEPVDPEDWHAEVPVNWLRNAASALEAAEARIAAVTVEKDEAQALADRLNRDAPESFTEVGELLAVIHRDGGHYEAQHGYLKAVKDAETVVLDDRARIAALEAENGALREAVHEARGSFWVGRGHERGRHSLVESAWKKLVACNDAARAALRQAEKKSDG